MLKVAGTDRAPAAEQAGASLAARQPPADRATEAAEIFASADHRDAVAVLVGGVLSRQGFLALTGEPGVGKSIALDVVLSQLAGKSARIIRVDHDAAVPLTLRAMTAQILGRPPDDIGDGDSARLQERLFQGGEGHDRVLLAIDNAHAIDPDVLAYLLLMSILGGLGRLGGRPPQVIFVGRPGFWTLLARGDVCRIGERITLRCVLGRLSEAEATAYLEHRLRRAGGTPAWALTPTALASLLLHGEGAPGRIDALLRDALAMAAAGGAAAAGGGRQLTVAAVEAAAAARKAAEQPARTAPAVADRPVPAPPPPADPAPPADAVVAPRSARSRVRVSAALAAGVVLLAGGAVGYRHFGPVHSAAPEAAPPDHPAMVAEAAAIPEPPVASPAAAPDVRSEAVTPTPQAAAAPAEAAVADQPPAAAVAIEAPPAPEAPAPDPAPPEPPAPEATAPEAAAPEATAPEATAPEATAPEVAAPEAAAPEAAAPEVAAPEATAPEVSAPEVAAPKVAAPEASAPEVSAPEIPAPEAPIPEIAAPDAPAPAEPVPAEETAAPVAPPASVEPPVAAPSPAAAPAAEADKPPAPVEPPPAPPAAAPPPPSIVAPAAEPADAPPPVAPAAEPALPQAQPPQAQPPPAQPPQAQPPQAQPSPAQPPAALSPAVVEAMIRRGDAMVALGDVLAARLLYERAAEGSARAATAAGATYDPAFLAGIGARFVRADPAAAAAWYRRAIALGSADAAARLARLEAKAPH